MQVLASAFTGGASLVPHAGGVLLVETARRSGLARGLSRLLGRWRLPLATHDPGKIVADLAVAVALGGDAACDVAVLRAQPECSARWPRTRRCRG
ncbi:transposase [Pseudonocardia sp. H11422]|uniref:transposase n=1 Tax=Pseudonocardia sp. H11422 TaxID=2835866 RepID=UPI001BDCC2C1